jgi:hypothetical protein
MAGCLREELTEIPLRFHVFPVTLSPPAPVRGFPSPTDPHIVWMVLVKHLPRKRCRGRSGPRSARWHSVRRPLRPFLAAVLAASYLSNVCSRNVETQRPRPVDPTDHTAAASTAVLPPVDGVDLSLMVTGLNVSHSPRVQVPMMPLHSNDLAALDAWDTLRQAVLSAAAAADGSQRGRQLAEVAEDGSSAGTTWDVRTSKTCKGMHYDFHSSISTLAGCEAICGAQPACVAFEWKNDADPDSSHWCSLFNRTTSTSSTPRA